MLLNTIMSGVNEFSQSNSLEINGVKDNQTLFFGDSGLVLYQSAHIPARLDMQLWVIESDKDVRQLGIDSDQVVNSNAFKGLVVTVEAALAVVNPILAGAIGVGGVVANLLRKKLKTNKDDLVGYWQCALSREEHYPYGVRDRQDIMDTTGNICVDYTLFGFEQSITG